MSIMEGKSELTPSTTEVGLSTENGLPFCGVCSVQFPSKKNLETHYEQNHLAEKLKCENCNKAFSSKFLFEKHSKKQNCKMKNKVASREFDDLWISVGNKTIHCKRPTIAKSFECGVCKRSFSSNSNLLNHIQKHKGYKKNVCHICERKFMLKVYLKRHLLTHTGERPYTCEECFRCFARKAQLTIHSRIHTGEMPYSCDICSKKFRHVGSLKSHSFFVHTEAGRLQLLSCSVCGTRFKEKRALLRHELRHKKISKPSPSQINNSSIDCVQDNVNHACVSNDELFRCQDNFKAQTDIHPEHKPYVCHICQQCFPNKESFKEHNDAHTNKAIPIISSYFSCNRNSGGENLKLDYHGVENLKLDYHNRIEEKFICNICDEQFDDSDGLQIHFKMHTEQNYYLCEVCRLCFIDEDALRNHEITGKCGQNLELRAHICKYDNNEKKFMSYQVLKSDQVKGYICSLCLKCFIDFQAFQQHMFEHANLNVCKICGKRFFTADILEAHCLEKHKPLMHPCIVCKEKFVSKNDLIAHCFSHLGSGEYFICALCKKCFKGREDLQKHSPCFTQTETS